AAAKPHNTGINVASGQVFDTAAHGVVPGSNLDVPFTSAELVSALSNLTGISIPLDKIDIPGLSSWFDNVTNGADAGRSLTDIIPGLNSVATGAESSFANALTALPGIKTVTFTSTGIKLNFDVTDLGASPTFSQAGTIDVPALHLDLAASFSAKLALGG